MTEAGTGTGAEMTPRSHESPDEGDDPSVATAISQRAEAVGGASSGHNLPGRLFSGVKGLSRIGGAATTVGSKGLSTAAGGGRRLAVGTAKTAKNLAGHAGGLAVEGGKNALPLVGQAGGLLNTALRNEQVQEVGLAMIEGLVGPRASALAEKAVGGRSPGQVDQGPFTMPTTGGSTTGPFRGQVSGWKASRRGEQSAPMLTDVPLYVTGGLVVRESPRAGRIFSIGGMDVRTDSIRSGIGESGPTWDHASLVEAADTPWRKRLRRHQSWYREMALGLPPGTILSGDGLPRPVSSRLPSWAVAEDPTLNFLANDEIYEVVLDRATRKDWGGIVEPDRLHHNLLSSQPLCFNLFAVLDEYGREELAAALGKLFGLAIDAISDVRIEYRPPLDDGFRSGSAFDCFIEYERGVDRKFLGIETKYAEDLSAQKPSKNPDYATITALSESGFKPEAASRLNAPSTCQLWYNAVLAHRLRVSGGYSEGRIALVACEADTSALAAAQAVRAEIIEPDAVLVVGTYEGLLEAMPYSDDLAGWKDHFFQRYLDFRLSAPRP